MSQLFETGADSIDALNIAAWYEREAGQWLEEFTIDDGSLSYKGR